MRGDFVIPVADKEGGQPPMPVTRTLLEEGDACLSMAG